MYFSRFPSLLFLVTPPSFGTPARYVTLTDITRNVRFKKEVIDNISLYDIFVMKESDSIETVSEKLYGSPYYHWVLMLLNNMYDWRKDFPLNSLAFDEYIKEKYGSIEIAKSTLLFYNNSKGLVVDSNHLNENGVNDASPNYAYDYELLQNDSKRKIKVISKELLSTVLSNFENLL
jgi:hypothetical protein